MKNRGNGHVNRWVWLAVGLMLMGMTVLLTGCRSDGGGSVTETTEGGVTDMTETHHGTDAETAETAETAEGTESETTANGTDASSMTVIAGGQTEYRLGMTAAVMRDNESDIQYLERVMTEKFGVSPARGATPGVKVPMIRLAYEKGTHPLDWSIELDGESGDISIRGGSQAGLSEAVRTFITRYCGPAKGDLILKADDGCRYRYEEDKIDNSRFLSYQGGDRTELVPSDSEGVLMTPAWLQTAVMVEVRIDLWEGGHTFASARKLVDFYAETGVNVLWLCPIYERGAGGNGYGNIGLHSVEPYLTGTRDYEKGWQEVRSFVDYAHEKGVYILLDLITWGTMQASPLVRSHPDWYKGEAWGNPAFNWSNEEMKEWFISQAVENIVVTGADGYRCDCEPNFAGYEVFAEIRRRLAERGHHVLIMSEDGSERRNAYDLEQDGVLPYKQISRGALYANPVNFFADGMLDIVRSCKRGDGLGAASLQEIRKYTGKGRFYTNCITNHDYQERNVKGNRVKIGYSAIYAPFIPLWFMGDEFGVTGERGVLYEAPVNYRLVGNDHLKTQFYEDVKKMLEIRRSYPEIFDYFPMNHRETNICVVEADGLNRLTNYARYAGNRMVLVLANRDVGNDGVCTVQIPFDSGFEKDYAQYRVTDLLTGQVIVEGDREAVDHFAAVVPPQYCAVFLVEGIE